MERVPGVTVRAHHGKIQVRVVPPLASPLAAPTTDHETDNAHTYTPFWQEKDEEFYKSFSVVIAGLDNIKARIWLNSTLFALAEKDEDGEFDLTCVELVCLVLWFCAACE